MQSKKASIIEVTISTVVGILAGYLLATILYPMFGIIVSSEVIFTINIIFMVFSLIKNYIIRRIFNYFS